MHIQIKWQGHLRQNISGQCGTKQSRLCSTLILMYFIKTWWIPYRKLNVELELVVIIITVFVMLMIFSCAALQLLVSNI